MRTTENFYLRRIFGKNHKDLRLEAVYHGWTRWLATENLQNLCRSKSIWFWKMSGVGLRWYQKLHHSSSKTCSLEHAEFLVVYQGREDGKVTTM